MNKSVISVVIGVVLGVALGSSIGPLFGKEEKETANASAQKIAASREVKLSEELARRAKLVTELVDKKSLSPTLNLVGSVDFDADAVADVGGRIAGRITRILVTVGDKVTRGQPLMEVESNELGEALAALLSARANLTAAEHHAARETALGQKQLSSAPVVETARANERALSAEMRGAEQRLLAMGLTAAELNSLKSGDGPRRITLRAPIEGEVVERYAVLGQVVDPTQPILRIADLSRLWVELDLFERDLAHVAIEDGVEILSETYPGRSFHGKVSYVDATVDTSTRTAKVRIEVPNPERLLRPGQFVHARLVTHGTTDIVIAIPQKALLQVDGEPAVFVQLGKDSYIPRPVQVGRVAGDVVEIKRGLLEGERLVTEGGFVLKSELQR